MERLKGAEDGATGAADVLDGLTEAAEVDATGTGTVSAVAASEITIDENPDAGTDGTG